MAAKKKQMKFLDFFSGIGGFHTGLEKAGMKCIGYCEFDKFAQNSYKAIYDTEGLYFNNDIRTIKGKDLPKADLWTFGFPCQDISIAGNKKGIKDGTRSGLFFEVMRLLDECEKSNNKPKWLIVENVKNLLSIDKGRGFFTVLSEMAERGYSIEWKMYNSKNYGVPQSRERVYLVGYYGNSRSRKLLPTRKENEASLRQIIPGSQTERVYDAEGISCTLMARGSTGTGLYKVNDGQNIRIRRLTPLESWRLQGFSDAQFEAAAAVTSSSQLHKQAGNAVTVNVVEEIGRHIIETNDFLDNLSIN